MPPPLSPPSALDRSRQILIWAALAAALGWAALRMASVLTPLTAALLFAYVLAGPVDRLERAGLPRPAGAAAMILVTTTVAASGLLILVPIVQSEIELLRQHVPDLVARIGDSVLPWLERTMGVRVRLDAQSIRTWLSAQMADGGGDIAAWILDYARSGGSAALEIVSLVLLVPIVLFYLLVDWHPLRLRTLELVPPRWRGALLEALAELHGMIAGWLRGMLIVTVALATFYAGGLWVADFQLWWPLGVLTGLLMFIPYLGFALGLVLALIAGMLQFGPLDGALRVALVYGLGQAIESWWLTPKLVGERVGLHPIAVIVALLVFGALFGFVGVLLALPLAAAATVVLRRVKWAWIGSGFFRHGPEPEYPAPPGERIPPSRTEP